MPRLLLLIQALSLLQTILDQCSTIHAFQIAAFGRPASSSSSSSRTALVQWLAAPRRSGTGPTKNAAAAASKKKKARQSSSSPTIKRKNMESSPSRKVTSAAATTSGTKQQQQQQHIETTTKKVKKSPPWQVLNAKEAKKNVEKEIERRSTSHDNNNGVKSMSYTPSTENASMILSKAFLSDTESRLLQWKSFSPYTNSLHVQFHGAHVKTLPRALGVPEIAFLGRSNVGKSSLLNALTRQTIARVGKTPGATASVNLYSISSSSTSSTASSSSNTKVDRPLLGLVDLPGFGYAKLAKTVKDDIAKLAETYLDRRQELAVGILLVDIRREPKEDDKAVLAALYDVGVPILVVASKLDKIDNDTQRQVQLTMIRNALGLPDGQPLAVSSETGEGTRLLWRIILEGCEDHIASLNERYVEQQQQEVDDDDEDDTVGEASSSSNIAFDDDDDIAYEQGYDWIHGTAMLEEEEDLDEDEDESLDDDGTTMDESSSNYYEDDGAEKDWDRMTIQDWDRKSRDLERQGLL